MTDAKQKPGTPDSKDDRSPARSKDQAQGKQAQSQDLPGADGEHSAGANEDTYD